MPATKDTGKTEGKLENQFIPVPPKAYFIKISPIGEMTEDDLRGAYEDVGKIEAVEILKFVKTKDGEQKPAAALIGFKKEEDRDAAAGYEIEMDGKTVQAEVYYKSEEKTPLFVANIEKSKDSEDIEKYIKEIAAPYEVVDFERDSVWCFVHFKCLSDATKARELIREGSLKSDDSKLVCEYGDKERHARREKWLGLDPKKVRSLKRRDRRRKKAAEKEPSAPIPRNPNKEKVVAQYKRTLFVRKLPFVAQEDDIWAHFSRFGTILSIQMPRRQEDGASRGFAFVEYTEPWAARKAIKDGTTQVALIGRKEAHLEISISEPQKGKANNKDFALFYAPNGTPLGLGHEIQGKADGAAAGAGGAGGYGPMQKAMMMKRKMMMAARGGMGPMGRGGRMMMGRGGRMMGPMGGMPGMGNPMMAMRQMQLEKMRLEQEKMEMAKLKEEAIAKGYEQGMEAGARAGARKMQMRMALQRQSSQQSSGWVSSSNDGWGGGGGGFNQRYMQNNYGGGGMGRGRGGGGGGGSVMAFDTVTKRMVPLSRAQARDVEQSGGGNYGAY